MADGSGGLGGGLGGTLFEATKKAVGGQVQATAQAIGAQVTGKPAGVQNQAAGKMPSLDDFGDFGKLFEKNQPGGQKSSPIPSPTQNKTPQQLQQMADEQNAQDAQKVAQLTSELHQLYAKPILESGENLLKKQEEERQQAIQEEEITRSQEKNAEAQEQELFAAPGAMKVGQMTNSPVSTSGNTAADRSGEAGKRTG